MSLLLFGEGPPVFNINGVANIYEFPQPSTYEDFSIPDVIVHKILGGIEDTTHTGQEEIVHRGFWPYFELYYDKLTQQQAIWIRNLLNATKQGKEIIFRPHRDFPRSFRVTVNRDEGWDLGLVMNKYANGYEGTLVVRGLDRIAEINTVVQQWGGMPFGGLTT